MAKVKHTIASSKLKLSESDDRISWLMKRLQKIARKNEGRVMEIPEFAKKYATRNSSGITLIYHKEKPIAAFEKGRIYPLPSMKYLSKLIEKHNINL